MKKFTLTIPITPAPWQRPKTRVVNGWVKHYSPDKTKDYERAIAEYYKQATKGFKYEKGTPVCVNIVFGMPIPSSLSNKKKMLMAAGDIQHIKRPDIDNMIKAVLDALNGVAWEDDSQIVRLTAGKEYANEPFVYLYIHEGE